MSKEPKETEVKKETEVTGMPPTPEKLTPLGAPVDERFATPNPPQTKPEPKEDNAKRRSPKSEEDNETDDPREQSKRRR